MAGHKPRVFGQPFYAGWGLSVDENPPARRNRTLTRAQLFAGAMIHASTWYDPFRDKLTTLEVAMEILAARARAWREDRKGWVAAGMSKHKTRRLQQIFGQSSSVKFSQIDQAIKDAANVDRPLMIWSSKMSDSFRLRAAQEGVSVFQVEDGFVRSRGLGAALVPPMSLSLDRLGIHYDPLPESHLENLIQESPNLTSSEIVRARRLISDIRKTALSKYNQGPPVDTFEWPEGPRVLVVGQVEDDASVVKGCADGIATNLELLQAARTGVPNGTLVYKPHPDVVSGLRKGAVEPDHLSQLADVVLENENPASVLDQVEAVWTLTSLMGFEALLRGLPVTCVGTPFYAGWGLTRDFGRVPGRRTAKPTLEGLVHAALIEYPRYFDPVSASACPVKLSWIVWPKG